MWFEQTCFLSNYPILKTMRLPSVSYLFNSFLNAAKRFPLPVILAVIATVSNMYLIESSKVNEEPVVFKLLLTCWVFFPLFIAFSAAREANDSSKIGLLIANLVGIGLFLAYWYWGAPDPATARFTRVTRFFLFGAITHLIATFLPYLQHGNLDDFWEYNRQLFITFFMGALYSVLIYAGVAFALLAVDMLFNIDVEWEVYAHLWALTAAFFHPMYFLSNFPKGYEFEINQANFHRGFVNLIKFVFIPIVCLYLLILYAYGGKMLFTWELPEGWVSRLVIGFSVVGVLTYLLNFMLPKVEQSGWVKNYRKWFFYALMPVTLLLFIAIYRRLSDYGFTELRYFVFLTGIWLTGICLYFIISRKDDIRVIPISLALACLVAGLGGPISAFSVAKNSQQNRLETYLTKTGIWKDGKLNQQDPPLESEDADEIRSITKYLINYEHEEVLKSYGIADSLLSENNRYADHRQVLKAFGIKTNSSSRAYQYLNFSTHQNEMLQVSDYDYFVRFDSYNRKRYRNDEPNSFDLKISEGTQLVFENNGKSIETIDINGLLKILETDFKDDLNLRTGQMCHYHKGEKVDILISFSRIKFRKGADKKISDIKGDIFWIEK